MAYKFYNAYLTVAPSSPQQGYKDDLQALINQQFNNASDTYTIQEELVIGSNVLTNVDVRITHVLSDKNTGTKLGDDWRNIIFQDLDHLYGLGHRYYFNDYYWLTVNTDFYKYVTASAIVRRCNHTLKWYNDVGKLIEEPCIVDYFKMSAANNVDETKYIRTGANIRYIYLQNNSEAYKILRDRRFIIDRRAYRCIDYDSITMPGLYELTLEEHAINTSTDDIVNGICNAFGNSVYTIDITTPDISMSVGATPVQIEYVVKYGGIIVTDQIVLFSSSNTSITTVSSTGIVTPVANGSSTITVSLAENSAIYDTVNIVVASAPVSNVVEDIVGSDTIAIGESSSYSIYKYDNGTVQADTYTFTLSGTGATLTIVDGNNATITASAESGTVTLTATNNITAVVKTKIITLTTLW